MKVSKLLAALMPTLAVASNATTHATTTTVVTPVTTRTHTNTVFVTASAGPTVSTCLASFCGYSNTSAANLSTIRLTSFTTATTTKVITPPDTTTTIDHATEKSLSTSCAMRTPSTNTVTVTETSIPIITRSVYPIPASNETNEPATHTPSYPSKSLSSTGSALSSPPYLNASNTNTMVNCTAGTTGYMPLQTGVLGALPDNGPSLSAMLAAMSSLYPVNTIHGSITSTEGSFITSSSVRLRPLQLFVLFARFISFIHGAVATDKVFDTSVQNIKSRLYPYPAPVNPGPPPHLANTRRGVVPNTTIEVNTTTLATRILGTMTTTSTFTLTVTDVPTATSKPVSTYSTPGPPFTFSFSTMTHNNVTISVTVTVTELVTPTLISATTTLTSTSYTTLISNVTNTVEKQTTHTATVTKTTTSFTEGAAPIAGGTIEELNFFLCYAMIATWFVLFAVA